MLQNVSICCTILSVCSSAGFSLLSQLMLTSRNKESPDRWLQYINVIQMNLHNTFYNYMTLTLTNMSQIGEVGSL